MPEKTLEKTNELLKELDLSMQADKECQPCYPAETQPVTEVEEKKLDAWRILLVDFVYQLSRCMMDERLLEKDKSHEIIVAQFIDTLRRLDQMPDHEGV
ncbi:MAG: hypothetical protein MUP22_11845, partial [Desulfobacterales bacterium]|nr:hypothetical protein [Desulfobacterales bacterium]